MSFSRAKATVQLSANAFQQFVKQHDWSQKLQSSTQVTGIQAAKWTSHLLPLTHTVLLDTVKVSVTIPPTPTSPSQTTRTPQSVFATNEMYEIEVSAEVKGQQPFHTDMHSLLTCSVAALHIVNLCTSGAGSGSKKDMREAKIQNIRLY